MATGSAAGSNTNLINKTNTPTVGAVVLTRTLTNVMDIGMLNFEIEVKEQELNADSCVCLSVPTYYNPTVGGMPRCAYWDATAGADLETVFCASTMDWSLTVWGPTTAVAKAAKANLRVYGV